MTLRNNIRRALRTPCTTDILRHFIQPVRAMGCAGVSRNTFSRLNDVLLELRSGKTTNATKLAREFRSSTKSIQRDLHFLRAEGFAITWDASANSYRLADSDNHPWLQTKGVI
jgi:hypothetical protein